MNFPPEWKKNKTVWMRPEGINYRGGMKLNGRFVTGTVGTFSRVAIDVSEFVNAGVDDLEVEVFPVDQPGKTTQKPCGAPGEWFNGGDGEIGRNVTVLMCAGWDFMFQDGIRDRYTGIWKDITFFATDTICLDAPYARTKLNGDMSEAELTFEVDCISSGYTYPAQWNGVLEAEIEGTDVRFVKRMSFFRGERRTERLTATLKNPELWWPRNKGNQNLYTLKARFVLDAREAYDAEKDVKYDLPVSVSDEVTVRFGVREFKSDQSGKDGARKFYVNRRPIYIRGTNWIPEGMLRQDDVRMEKEVRLTAESGVNMVRLWAGGIVESDRFYELCDEYGLLVWQEHHKLSKSDWTHDLESVAWPVMDVIEVVNLKIKAFEKSIRDLAEPPEFKGMVERVRTVYGEIGSTAFVAIIGGDPDRFDRSRDVGAYLGMIPKQDQSGDKDKQLYITHAGSSLLRSALVECAGVVMQANAKETDLKLKGLRIAMNGGRIAKKKAKVAVARGLAENRDKLSRRIRD